MDASDDDLQTRAVLAAEIAERLAMDIVTLKLPPGSRLIEEEVGRRFGISRSPVREAMRMLDADGLTQRAPRRGCIVAPMSRADLENIYTCRLALEPLAAAGTANAATPKAIEALQTAWNIMRQARDAADPHAAFLANMRLTDLLHAHCGNPVLARLLSAVDKQGLRYRFICYRQVPAFLSSAVEENATLITAIAARDAVSARAVTERLIAAALRTLRDLLPGDQLQDEA
jgi:DNA-binding GntR family transcriptional regulator